MVLKLAVTDFRSNFTAFNDMEQICDTNRKPLFCNTGRKSNPFVAGNSVGLVVGQTDERSVPIRINCFYLSNRHMVCHVVSPMVLLQRGHQSCGKVMLSVVSVSLFIGGCLHVINIPVLDFAMQGSFYVWLASGWYAFGRKAFLLKHVNTFSYPWSKHFRIKPWLLIKTRIKLLSTYWTSADKT